jgi:hypothetical protein
MDRTADAEFTPAPATAASGVGSYALTGSAVTGTGLGNCTITYVTIANGLTVTLRLR